MSMWDHLAGAFALVARAARRSRVSLLSPDAEHAADVAGETPTVAAIFLAGHAFAAQAFDDAHHFRRRRLRNRAAASFASCSPAKPSCSKRSTHLAARREQTPTASLAACGVCPLTIILAAASTVRRQAGILVDVHSALPRIR